MSVENDHIQLPSYSIFSASIAVLDLPISPSELHGIMCGYLCAGAAMEAEAYLRTLTPNKKEESIRAAALAIFEVFTLSQHQLAHFDVEFQLLLPEDYLPLNERAQAFGEWCEGFTQSMTIAGVGYEQFQEEDAQEALRHLIDFAHLEYESLDVEEEDEQALVEVSEYARMAVLRLYSDLFLGNDAQGSTKTTH